MFTTFLAALREAGIAVSIGEYLAFLGALRGAGAIVGLEDFHTLARMSLVKDERWFDRFDLVFGRLFGGAGAAPGGTPEIPAAWLEALAARMLTDEERARIEAMGGLDEVLRRLAERLAEQDGAHHGGGKWIGTGGTSPFGNGGYNPLGVRIGGRGGERRAGKVWEHREFRDLDDDAGLGTRATKIALRRLRRFGREGARRELDLDGTVAATASNAGLLDLRLRAERRNTMRVAMLLDVGGSMDGFVSQSTALFSAARSEFRELGFWYFHNCPYERLWTDNRRRAASARPTLDLIRGLDADHRLMLVGDATMGPSEITHRGGSVEHVNDEAGHVWLRRLLARFPRAAWLNPVREGHWGRTPSIEMVRELMGGRMFPMTLGGIDDMVRDLAH